MDWNTVFASISGALPISISVHPLSLEIMRKIFLCVFKCYSDWCQKIIFDYKLRLFFRTVTVAKFSQKRRKSTTNNFCLIKNFWNCYSRKFMHIINLVQLLQDLALWQISKWANLATWIQKWSLQSFQIRTEMEASLLSSITICQNGFK